MRNLFKKALAFCLVAALALTCFAGTFYAAEPYTATISVDSKTITLGTETVDVVLNISSPAAGINEALFKVSSDLGTVTAVDVAEDDIAIIDYATNDGETVSDYGSFYLSAKNTSDGENGTVLGSINAATITVTFVVADTVEAGKSYDINIETSGVKAASKDEDVITLSYETAKVIVEEEATECEHANVEYVSHVIATESAPIGSITYTCNDCETTITEDLIYNNTYRVRGANAEYNAEIVLNYNLYIDEWSEDADLTKSFGILNKEDNSSAEAASITKVYRVSEAPINPYNATHVVRVLAYPCAAKELADNFTYALIAYVDGVWYCGKTGNYSFATYANSTLGKSTVKETEKTLVCDILNYGTEAQKHFDYNVTNLLNKVNSSFDAYIAQYGTSVDRATVSHQAISNTGSVYRIGAASASFESRAEINIRINNADKSVFNGSTDDIVLIITYNDVETGETTIKATDFFVSGGQTYARFDKLRSFQVSDPINVKLYNAATYVEGSDANVPEAELTYSLETYAHNQINKGDSIAPLCKMLIRYGDAAYTHFVVAK